MFVPKRFIYLHLLDNGGKKKTHNKASRADWHSVLLITLFIIIISLLPPRSFNSTPSAQMQGRNYNNAVLFVFLIAEGLLKIWFVCFENNVPKKKAMLNFSACVCEFWA